LIKCRIIPALLPKGAVRIYRNILLPSQIKSTILIITPPLPVSHKHVWETGIHNGQINTAMSNNMPELPLYFVKVAREIIEGQPAINKEILLSPKNHRGFQHRLPALFQLFWKNVGESTK